MRIGPTTLKQNEIAFPSFETPFRRRAGHNRFMRAGGAACVPISNERDMSMKSIPSRFAPALAAVSIAVAACLAAATVVQAQTSPPPAPRGGPGEMHGQRPPGGPGWHMMREIERLKTSLQLNAQQAALWDRATAAMKPQGDLREKMKAQHDRATAMLDDPNFDPRKLAAETDRADAERRAKMNTVRDAWFAVYDSLNPVQRGQVREFLRERMSRHGGQGHGEGHDKGEWEQHGGEHRPPMAPPAPPAPAR
jgi:Spy/CpxP family protein refolding chaperone